MPKPFLLFFVVALSALTACQKRDSGQNMDGVPEAGSPSPDAKQSSGPGTQLPDRIAAFISPGDPASLQKAFQEAARAGRSELVIPPGVYLIPPLPTGGGPDAWHLMLEKARNLKIEATGATLIFTDRGRSSMTFQQCENVTLRGATLVRGTIPSTQGRIEAISLEDKTADVRIAKGYPADIDNKTFFPNIWLNVFDPATRQWKTDIRSPRPKELLKLAPDLFRIPVEPPDKAGIPVQPGDLVAMRGQTFPDLRVFECRGMKFVDVTIRSGSGFCFQDSGGDGGNYYERCRVTYGPRPDGATEDPLLSATADGFHSADNRKGPTLVDCSFEGLNDDAIAIHGTYAMVLEAAGNRLIAHRVAATRQKLVANVGDTLLFYDKNMVLAGSATVTGVKSLADYQPTFEPEQRYQAFKSKTRVGYVELTLDREVAAQPSWLIANQNQCGEGYVVRNCTIRNTTARGVYAQAPHGLIEGCTIEKTGRAAVEFNTETGIWSQSDYSNDVVVRNNTFRDVSTNRKTGELRHPGALTILAFDGKNYVPNPGGHRRIVVENNRFENIDGVNILICSADGVTIRKNEFLSPMRNAKEFGRDKGADPGALIWVNESSNVNISDNVVANPGPFLRELVVATQTGSGTGFDSGVRRALTETK